MGSDAKRILAGQAVRAFLYGFGSVLLGATLEARGWSGAQVGVLLGAILLGQALASVGIGRYGDRLGRRRAYALLFVGLAVAGLAFGLATSLWVLLTAALLGTLSTEVVESGPFTSLEQAMLPATVDRGRATRIFGTYNAVATVAGSIGALAAGGPALLRDVLPATPADHRFFLLFVPAGLVGVVLALSLSDRVEEGRTSPGAPGLARSRRRVASLAGLFAFDSLAGGFVLQSFIAFWFRRRFGVSLEVLGAVFFAVGLLQSASFVLAARIAERVGLLNTMVFTHLPSNLLLAAIPLAPSLPVAIGLLLGRFALSQMDVPTRQAYVVALVEPEERSAAVAYTNTARYVVRPLGPGLAGLAQQLAFGAPFVVAGAAKAVYDLALWAWFRRVPVAGAPEGPTGRGRADQSRKGDAP
jgi:MFS family permease